MKSEFVQTLRAMILLAFFAIASTEPARAASISITGSDTTVNATDFDSNYFAMITASGSMNPINTPVAFLTATENGYHSSSFYQLSDSAFDVVLNQTRGGVLNSRAFSVGQINFNVQPDVIGGSVTYTLSGHYSVTDAGGISGPAGYVAFWATLYDQTSDSYLSLSQHGSTSTPNQAFNLGQSGGDTYDNESGTLSGTLLAGHDYEFDYLADTYANVHADAGATANGNITLVFGDASPVPLPAAAPVGFFMLAGCGAFAAIRRKNARIASI